jgi:RNA polymerase sigma factor (sigma-70 family)
MDEREFLTERFEESRTHLRTVAYRMLGSRSEADDAVQEAWLRLARAEAHAIENLTGWLTTVVARVCLDMLRSRKSRAQRQTDVDTPEPIATTDHHLDPERDVLLADSASLALLVVLETLSPAERVAFVLHDLFDLTFEDIAPIVGRSPTATRQLASRGRRRVQGRSATTIDADDARRRALVEAFSVAARSGDFAGLLALLAPDIVVRADPAAVKLGASAQVLGARSLAESFMGRAAGARLALVDGAASLVWAPRGRPRVVVDFTIVDDKIVAIDLIADREHIEAMDLVLLGE